MEFSFDEKALAKAVRPQIEKVTKEANRDLERVYDAAEGKSDRQVQREVESVCKKYGFTSVDGAGIVSRFRAGERTLLRAG